MRKKRRKTKKVANENGARKCKKEINTSEYGKIEDVTCATSCKADCSPSGSERG
jgi:hypothetical protein